MKGLWEESSSTPDMGATDEEREDMVVVVKRERDAMTQLKIFI